METETKKKKKRKEKKLGGGLGSGWPGLVGPREQPLAQLDQVGPRLARWGEFFVLSIKCSPPLAFQHLLCMLRGSWSVDLEVYKLVI